MSLGEADVVRRLRQVAVDPAARGLLDDVAVLDGLVITHDTIAEAVHYLPKDPPASVGWKLVAVNLSDLAAKGARPAGALLSLTIRGDDGWEMQFLDGVEAAAETYGLPLIGGDTISLPPKAPRVLGLTLIGRSGPKVPDRSGAKPGDALWVVGTLGDSAAGLKQLHQDPAAVGPLVDIYRRPIPLLAPGQALAPFASASMDISDGLLLDASRMVQASGCGATIELQALPLSTAFIAEEGDKQSTRLFAATGGDDYALLFAFPADFDPFTLSLPSGTRMARIGTFEEVGGLRLTFHGEAVVLPENLGHEHRGNSPAPMADRP